MMIPKRVVLVVIILVMAGGDVGRYIASSTGLWSTMLEYVFIGPVP